jgi:alpha-N-arabinofuranosidase
MGRCIYGGIWAEMLEDRKFHFPITPEYNPYRALHDTEFPAVGASPWQIIGDAGSVAMSSEHAFVGKHSPRVAAASGIRQLDLGVLAGKSYTGYLWARPIDGESEIEVSLAWGETPAERESTRFTITGGDYAKREFTFTAKRNLERGAVFEIRVLRGDVLLGPPSLMPADNVNGLRADTLALLKQLDSPVYRWPGGNFVSGYDWRDGIGDRDRRPPRKNPAWTGVEHNDFGTDEFIAFCRELDTAPMIAVNTGFGDHYSAAQWVEYCNAGADTIGGSWRVKNGHAGPFDVRYWCVGNEMWGPFQLGFMQLHHYVLKHNIVAEAMWAVDPGTILVGVGDILQINEKHDPEQAKRGIPWSHGMLESCADHMNLLSEHFYSGRLPWVPSRGRVEIDEHVTQIRDDIRVRAEAHRKLQPTLANLKGRTIPISMDEWNYWHREYTYGELGCVYELQDGLGIAAGLHEFFRHTDLIKVATYAQTVNVIGAIKTSRTAAEMETTGLVLQMYRQHFGDIPLVLDQDFGALDVAAALTEDGRNLTIGVVNPGDSTVDLAIDLSGAAIKGPATRYHITGKDRLAHNTPGRPRVVDITRTDDISSANALPVPALSTTLFVVPLE